MLKKKCSTIFTSLFLILLVGIVQAENFGYNNLETSTQDTNYSVVNTNSSDYWDNLDTINKSQLKDDGGVLSILESWLTGFLNNWFGAKTTDDLTEGITNKYENQSWNETRANKLYGDTNDDTMDDILLCRLNQGTTCSNGETGTLTTTNLKGIWHFEEGTGNPADDSGNSNTITLTSGTWTAGGYYGSAIDFERDNNDRTTRADDPDFDPETNDFSFGLWIKPESLVDNEFFIWKYDLFGTKAGYTGKFDSDGAIDFTVRDGTNSYLSTSTSTLSAGNWYFIAMGWDNSAQQAFIYIKQDGQTGTYETFNNGGANIGSITTSTSLSFPAVGGNPIDGVADELFFFKGTYLTQETLDLLSSNRWWDRTYLDGKHMQGYYAFDGNSLSYSTTNNINKDQGTIEMWVYPTWDGDDGVNHFFFNMETASNANHIALKKGSGNKLSFTTFNNVGGSNLVDYAVNSSNFANNTWHHIAGTWDDGDLQLFLDGELVNDVESGTEIGDKLRRLPSTMYIGRDATSQINEAQAIIDELRISYRPLTPTEIKQSYERGLANRTHIMGEA